MMNSEYFDLMDFALNMMNRKVFFLCSIVAANISWDEGQPV